ncbi:DUF378 domain-containing protein [Salinicoccus bachuensis]|uniref:DUF378 domain-containing protein n=1 Tax=Salinicoccus bachuensis TaxID=3136731 RepID=A0ABZ3IDC7_9STAP
MKALDIIALVLLIVGGLNWLLVGLFEFDLVASIFGGQDAILSKIIYILVGLSALYCLKFFGLITDDDARHTAADDTTHRTADDTPGNRPVRGDTHDTADTGTTTDDTLGDRTTAGDTRTTTDDPDDLTNTTDEGTVRNRRTDDTDRL